MRVVRGDVVTLSDTWRFDALFATPAAGDHPAIVGIVRDVRFDSNGVDDHGNTMTVGIESGTELAVLRRLGDRLRGINNDPRSTDMTIAIGSDELWRRLVTAGLDEAKARVLVVELRQAGKAAEI